MSVPGGKVIILGAGISGLSAGWRLASYGFQVDLLEASERLGGLAGTFRQDSYCLDFGPHSFFSADEEIRHIVLDLFVDTLQPRARDAKFYFRGKYLDYPVSAANLLRQMGIRSAMACLLSFLFQKLKRPPHYNPVHDREQSVEDWALGNFGGYLYRFFFKPYTEQFWKMPCCDLSSRSIPSTTRISFMKTLHFLLPQWMKNKNEATVDPERLPTYYPSTGYGEIPDRVAKKFLDLGGMISLRSRAVEIMEMDTGVKVSYLQEGHIREIEGDYLISTIPLNLLIRILRPEAPREILFAGEQLQYRPLLVLGMSLNRRNVLKASYVYTLDRPYNRMSEMNRFSAATSPEGKNVIMLEIPCCFSDRIWQASPEELLDMCIPYLQEDGILKPHEVERLFVLKAEHAYPMYRLNYREHLDRVIHYLEGKKRVFTLGRGGQFRYMDIDQCMRRAFDLVDGLRNSIGTTYAYA